MRLRAGLALLAAAALAGCGLGAGAEREGGATLRVTRDFGQVPLETARRARVREGQTVMRFLQDERRVETRFGGKFVQSIDGLTGQGSTGNRDWLYFVNGLEADVGAADRALSPGDVVQWDYRRWDSAMSVPAIVGAYPEPFVSGRAGRRLPTRVECEDDGAPACTEARDRLEAHRVPVTVAPLGAPASPQVIRVLVGKWGRLRTLRSVQPLEQGPQESGVFARFSGGGRTLELLGADGRVARAAAPGTGLVAATGRPGGEVVWVVSGLDDAGVGAAARALDPGVLRDLFAVALEPGRGATALPIGARTAIGGKAGR